MSNKTQISDVNMTPIRACCQFPYKGHTISISTVFAGAPGIIAILMDSTLLPFYTVEDAIKHIDQLENQ